MRISSKFIKILQTVLYLVVIFTLIFFVPAALASAEGESQSSDAIPTVLWSVCGGTALNQLIETMKRTKEVPRESLGTPQQQKECKNLIKVMQNQSVLLEKVKNVQEQNLILRRRVSHQETFLVRKFPENFNPKQTC